MRSRLWKVGAIGIILGMGWNAPCPGQAAGDILWKTSAGWTVHSLSAAGDVNGDGVSDVFVGSGDNAVLCFSGNPAGGDTVIWRKTIGGDAWSVVAIPDVNADGIQDCLAGAADNTVWCLSGQPVDEDSTSVFWSFALGGDGWSVASIGDVSGDGIGDGLVGAGDDQVVCIDGVLGTVRWSYIDPARGTVFSVSAISDVNGDGKDDCLAGGENDKVVCLSGGSSGSGTLLWKCATGSTVLTVSAISDVNGDGFEDALAGSEDDRVYCISGKSTGTVLPIWSVLTGSSVRTVSPIGDVNGDGTNDVLAGGDDDMIRCLSGKNGALLWSLPVASSVTSVVSVQDVNGNGGEDALSGGQDNTVQCIDGKSSGTGSVIWSAAVEGSVTCIQAISDLDGNGSEDVLAGSDDSYVYAYEGGDGAQVVETVSTPDAPSGPSSGKVGEFLSFSTGNAVSNLGHPVLYRFDWGDGNVSGWGSAPLTKSYTDPGTYSVKTQACCQTHPDIQSDWSSGKSVSAAGHVLTFSIAGSGSLQVNPARAGYSHGESVTLSAGAAAGFRFDHWSGDLSGSVNPAALVMDEDKSVTAHFVEILETVSTPDAPSGPSSGKVGDLLSFSTGNAVSNLGHPVLYRFDWGDGSMSEWGSESGSHGYGSSNTYLVKAQACCSDHQGITSGWSDGWTVSMAATGIVQPVEGPIPEDFSLAQNFPNPFNSGTMFEVNLPKDAVVVFDITNLSGERVAVLASGFLIAGSYRIGWDGNSRNGLPVGTGVYIARIQAGGFRAARRLLLIK